MEVRERDLGNRIETDTLEYIADIDTFLDIMPVGIFVLNADFQVIRMNSTLEQYFNISREEVLGRDKRKLIQEKIQYIFEEGDDFRRRVFATYDDNTYLESFVCHLLPAKGRKERWLEHRSEAIKSGPFQGGRIELYTDVTERILAEQELDWISVQFMRIQEKEKARIARDLHDGLGQAIIAEKLLLEGILESLAKCNDLDAERKQLLQIISEVEKTSDEIRRISFDLMPSTLELLGLPQTLEWMRDHFASLYDLDIDYQSFGLTQKRLPPELEVPLFRIFQEGLNNVVKHAQARHVQLRLIFSHPKVIAIVSDDGKGFSPKNDDQLGIGLKGMKQRIAQLGGTLKIQSSVGTGTTIRAEIPYRIRAKRRR
jgi:signal transduction histidine kinase